MKALRAILSASALCALAPAAASAIGYPTLDTASHWTLQNWGSTSSSGFFLQGAGKHVLTGPGQKAHRSVFYNTSVVGIRLNGRDYPLPKADYIGELEGATYLVRYAGFTVFSGLVLTVVYYLHDNGEFETYAYFQGPSFDPSAEWELVQRLDYDIQNAGNNTAEFLWSPGGEGGSTSPPQLPRLEALDAKLVYAPSSGPSYWSTVNHEITVQYPALNQTEGAGREPPAIARILCPTQPQFGMLIWGDPAGPQNVTFRAYSSFDGNLGFPGNPALVLQLVGEDASRPRHATSGRDQMAFIRNRVPADGVVRFRAKLFQRPPTRPLAIRVFQHPSADLDSWTFDPDLVVRDASEGPRTFRKALSELIGSDDLEITVSGNGLPYLPYEGFAGPDQGIQAAQMHNLFAWARSSAPTSPSAIREFQIDIFLVNWTLQGEGDAWESSFDKDGADLNRISREGAAVFWPNIRRAGTNGFARAQAILSTLHGIGLAMNMHPAWSNCPFAGYCWSDGSACGGVRCGAACPPGASNCRYRAHTCEHECVDGTIMSNTDINRNKFMFNSTPAIGSKWSEVDWYRYAPEAWVKPGRFGIGQVTGPQLPLLQSR